MIATTSRASLSPVLERFQLNPFRVLRLSIDATTDEAIWRSEEALTLARASLQLSEPDVLPWMPAPDEHETRQAAQWLEEPLRRMLEQVFWFDFQAGPGARELEEALAQRDTSSLALYLHEGPQDQVSGNINKANVCLLLGALTMAGQAPVQAGPVEGPAWESKEGLSILKGAHKAAHGEAHAQAEQGAQLWQRALGLWAQLAASPQFLDYLKSRPGQAGDDLLREEDAEAVVGAVKARLTDILSAEVKAYLLAGRLDCVRALLSVTARDNPDVPPAGHIEPRQWALSLRPLRAVFRTELDDMESILMAGDVPSLDDVALYLDRLDYLAGRWNKLDPTNLLGLDEFIDAGVTKAHGVLSRNMGYEVAVRVGQLLHLASRIARAASVKERIEVIKGRLESYKEWVCHYCHEREAEAWSMVTLRSRKFLHTTYGFNSRTHHFSIMFFAVRRCPRCADLHDHIFSAVRWLWAAPTALLVLVALVHAYLMPHPIPMMLATAAAAFAGWVCYFVFRFPLRRLMALFMTPRGDRYYWDTTESAGYKSMLQEGYSEEATTYTSDAYERMNAEVDKS
jgi:hypothetical protein